MLYLGIDQHKSQLTVNVRGEDGEVVLKRQVSTGWEKVRAFFADLAEKARPEGGLMAIVEVCGMKAWLLEMLKSYGCAEIVVTQPTSRSKQKTDRRDAGELSHGLWVHRQPQAAAWQALTWRDTTDRRKSTWNHLGFRRFLSPYFMPWTRWYAWRSMSAVASLSFGYFFLYRPSISGHFKPLPSITNACPTEGTRARPTSRGLSPIAVRRKALRPVGDFPRAPGSRVEVPFGRLAGHPSTEATP